MADYQRMYLLLFNAVTDALELLERGEAETAAETLRSAQCSCEEIYMEEKKRTEGLNARPSECFYINTSLRHALPSSSSVEQEIILQ